MLILEWQKSLFYSECPTSLHKQYIIHEALYCRIVDYLKAYEFLFILHNNNLPHEATLMTKIDKIMIKLNKFF